MESSKTTSAESEEVDRIIREDMTDAFCTKFIEVEKHVWMPEFYPKFADSIKNFEVRDDDIFVISFPKSGTTWTQEMVWMIANDLDFKGAETLLTKRFPFLDYCTLSDYAKMDQQFNVVCPDHICNSIEYAKNARSPRFLKTHLPYVLLPDQIRKGEKSPKIIYVTRNPKDTCVSFLHHGKIYRSWRANLENFAKVFLADKAMYGSFWKHILGYWEHRNDPNFLFLKFEDLKADLPCAIKKVATFLNKSLTNEQVQLLSKHLSFENMKTNNSVNDSDRIEVRKKCNLLTEDGSFIRAGKVGKYKNELSEETIKRFDIWTKKNLEGTDFGLQYNYNL